MWGEAMGPSEAMRDALIVVERTGVVSQEPGAGGAYVGQVVSQIYRFDRLAWQHAAETCPAILGMLCQRPFCGE